jgi:hypothetical protein
VNTSAALDLLMARLTRSGEAELRAAALNEIILAQETELEGGPILPWFLISEEASSVTPSDGSERRIAIPTDFIREVEENALWVVDSDGKRQFITKRPFDELMAKYGSDATGELPEFYALQGGYFHLFPITTLELPVKMNYFKRAATPTDSTGSENVWFKYAADLMIACGGLAIAAEHIRDAEVVAMFEAQKTRAWARLEVMDTARAEANMSRSMG